MKSPKQDAAAHPPTPSSHRQNESSIKRQENSLILRTEDACCRETTSGGTFCVEIGKATSLEAFLSTTDNTVLTVFHDNGR